MFLFPYNKIILTDVSQNFYLNMPFNNIELNYMPSPFENTLGTYVVESMTNRKIRGFGPQYSIAFLGICVFKAMEITVIMWASFSQNVKPAQPYSCTIHLEKITSRYTSYTHFCSSIPTGYRLYRIYLHCRRNSTNHIKVLKARESTIIPSPPLIRRPVRAKNRFVIDG